MKERDWLTHWLTIPACVWNEHHVETAPEGCEWVLVGTALDETGMLATMGFALTDELMRLTTMDDFIDDIAFPELLNTLDETLPGGVGDVVVNYPRAVYG